MPQRGEKTARAAEIARLVNRQIRHAENASFLRRMPGFELQKELPAQWGDLLHRLQEKDATSRRLGLRRKNPRFR